MAVMEGGERSSALLVRVLHDTNWPQAAVLPLRAANGNRITRVHHLTPWTAAQPGCKEVFGPCGHNGLRTVSSSGDVVDRTRDSILH